jgi:hypothetical protein
MEEFFEYIGNVLRAIGLGLTLKANGVQIAQRYPHANWIAFGVVMVAGISLLLGHSVILFLNQIRPSRFLFSLVANGLLLAIGWVIWSAAVWGVGSLLFARAPSFDLALKVIAFSYAPLAFAFLSLMPYLGPFVLRLLYAWSFLIAIRAIALTFDVHAWQALLCVGIGWLLLVLLTSTVGRPLIALQDWLWHRITGTHAGLPTRELPTPFAIVPIHDEASASEPSFSLPPSASASGTPSESQPEAKGEQP